MHNINTYIGRQAAWHTLGTVTGKFMTWTEILAHGGLDFSVVKTRLLHPRTGEPIEAWGTFRSDNDVFLGAVGAGYTPISHATGFELVDALVASVEGAHYETAGVLGQGERVWGLAALNQRIQVGSADDLNVYLLFSTSHDGTLSYNFRIVVERVVCQNTLGIALGERTKASFSIRHTSKAQDRIDDAHRVLADMGDDIARIQDKLNFLAGRKMTREAMGTIMDRLFPKRTKDDGETPVNATRRENILADVLKIYELNDGNAFQDQRGTAYNLLNAITNYADHERSTRGNGMGRAESALFGSGNQLKDRAFEVIVEAAAGLPEVPSRITVYDSGASTGSSVLDSVVAESCQ